MPEISIRPSPERQPEIPPASLVSVTSMRLKDASQHAEFMNQVRKVMRQLKGVPGVVARPRIYLDGGTYYTITVWQDSDSMQRFRDEGDHGEAMALAPFLAEKVLSANWTADAIPSSENIKEQLEQAAAEQSTETTDQA